MPRLEWDKMKNDSSKWVYLKRFCSQSKLTVAVHMTKALLGTV